MSMELSCGANFAKFLMIFINVIFWLAGVALLAVGLWLLFDENPFDFLEGSEIVNPMDDPLWSVAIYILVAVGAFIFLLGFLGCCGACMNNQCMIFLYIVLVSIVLIIEIVGAVMMVVFKGKMNESIRDEMYEGLITRYKGEDAPDGDSTSWNSMQTQLECCGANDFRDYQQSAWYNNTEAPKRAEFLYLDRSLEANYVLKKVPSSVPYTCCVMRHKEVNKTEVIDFEKCLEDAKNLNMDSEYLHTTGCYDSMKTWVDSHALIIIGVAFGFIFIQIFGLIIACCLRSAISDANRAETI